MASIAGTTFTLEGPVAVDPGDRWQGAYRFDSVQEGRYQIIAGSDADNDLIICDPGEACGALLTVDQPLVIEIDGNRADLDFPVEYQVAIPDISSSSRGEPPVGTTRVLPNP